LVYLKFEITQFFQKKDIKIPGILEVSENVEKIQKLADESQKTYEGMKNRIDELNKISSFSISVLKAHADDRSGLEELHRFLKSEDQIFAPLAKLETENLLRAEEHLNSLSSDKQMSFYFPNENLASITEKEISEQFLKKCLYRDEVWEFFDAMRKDSGIPQVEKLKFYFRIIKEPTLGKSVLAYRWATELIDSTSGWPYIQPGKKTNNWDRFSSFQDWYDDRQKK